MVDGNAPGFDLQGNKLMLIRVKLRVGHRADEDAVLVMVIEGTFMRARNNQQRSVFKPHIIKGDADGQQVVVGVGVEGPVLVPFDRAAELGRFHIQLVAVSPYAGADQLLDNVQDAGVAYSPVIDGVLLDWVLEAAQLG